MSALLTACGSGSGPSQPDDPLANSQLNSGNVLQSIALAQRAQDSALVLNQLFRLASAELLAELPAKSTGACSGGGDFSYSATAQYQSLQLNQCQFKSYRYRKGTLTHVDAASGGTLTLTDVGFDQSAIGMSFDASGTVTESLSAGQWRWRGDVKIGAGQHSDVWKYSLETAANSASADVITGEMSLQSSRLKAPLTVRWLAGNPGLVIQSADGSSVTVTTDGQTRGTAQLRSPSGATMQHSFTADELQAAMKAWSY
ncbi:hypothetical protein ACS5PK_21615 [Roseateles sp. DB2]|uniref:hypothetical protein n=1 Tax=Roseateles sp. DB2 TaxID=3453717 RepID=UPI003EE99845